MIVKYLKKQNNIITYHNIFFTIFIHFRFKIEKKNDVTCTQPKKRKESVVYQIYTIIYSTHKNHNIVMVEKYNLK